MVDYSSIFPSDVRPIIDYFYTVTDDSSTIRLIATPLIFIPLCVHFQVETGYEAADGLACFGDVLLDKSQALEFLQALRDKRSSGAISSGVSRKRRKVDTDFHTNKWPTHIYYEIASSVTGKDFRYLCIYRLLVTSDRTGSEIENRFQSPGNRFSISEPVGLVYHYLFL